MTEADTVFSCNDGFMNPFPNIHFDVGRHSERKKEREGGSDNNCVVRSRVSAIDNSDNNVVVDAIEVNLYLSKPTHTHTYMPYSYSVRALPIYLTQGAKKKVASNNNAA